MNKQQITFLIEYINKSDIQHSKKELAIIILINELKEIENY